MARRSPVDEKPFRPLDVSALKAVIRHRPGEADGETRVVDLAPSPAAPPAEPQERSAAQPVNRRLEKRVLFTHEETQAIDRLVSQLANRLRTQVKASHVLRAMSSLLIAAEAQIGQRAEVRGTLVRPANGDFSALQRFEREIAQILAHGLRDAGLPRLS